MLDVVSIYPTDPGKNFSLVQVAAAKSAEKTESSPMLQGMSHDGWKSIIVRVIHSSPAGTGTWARDTVLNSEI